ncbi:cbb3-type cytochrome c oxidase subunit I [Desulfitobacterium metallireducens]|uniref:Nitric-oxide reductase n=1 Tax=Desulfitobacterium metallireducens DSM 15288 TaxID=871968 RepID=W0E8H3_9FIRM|nr:cbb3-type cytochrome c oxidase subunit I [Desulfitobacterium metallireducens]AHF07155.1 nitric-oxide reductase [Desulfitobacterium metallireducens DSM 15288]
MKLNQTVLGFIISKILKKTRQNDEDQKARVEKENGKKRGGQALSRRFAFLACALFVVQGFVAILGATSLVVPDLPSPVPYEYGRSVHLGLATCWPLIGAMGMVYFFTVDELKADLYSLKIVRWQFWIVVLSTAGLLGTLTFRIGNGREFLDGLPMFYAGISLAILLCAYNLIQTLKKSKQHITPASAIMTGGMVFLGLLLIPNVLNYTNPIVDEAVKYWVVHLWEEMAFELITSGFIASFFIASGLVEKKDMEKWLYLEASLAVSGGLFGTGHHYYWIGYPAIWLIIGVVFSLIQMIPVILLAHLTYKGLKRHRPLKRVEKLTLWMILSSLLYHLTGASMLGMLMTIPWVNLYTHGTYITSGHAHLALFGVMGFLVLAGSHAILSRGTVLSRKSYIWAVAGVLFLNLGVITMSSSLLVAGFLQSYLWRYLGMDFTQVQGLISPYLLARVAGGSFYTVGSILFGWRIVNVWWLTREDGKISEEVSKRI